MLYAALEPDRKEFLDTGHGHRVYMEVCGKPAGVPALFLHGGPGSSINPNHRRFFDPNFYRIVLFDQRGCGRSIPRGSVENNTTSELIGDIERLRVALAVDRWMLFGGSWGSTLALAYAQAHPQRVSGLVLRGVFGASAAEIEWYVQGLRRFMPEAWHALVEGIEDPQAGNVMQWYAGRVFGSDPEQALHASQRWTAYETAVMTVGESSGSILEGDPAALIDRVRVQLHYLRSDCFLSASTFPDELQRIVHLPAIIVQGRRDLVCPPVTAYRLHRHWPGSQLRIVEEAGHSAMHPALTAALVKATQDMQVLLQ